MTSVTRTGLMLLFACMSFTLLARHRVATGQAVLPNPVLVFMGREPFETGGKSFTRYRYAVDNHGVYPNMLFAPAPALPPCGSNTNASRTWVDFYDQSGRRLNGFCALKTSADLDKIWFALESEVVPPSWVYIELTDRETNTKYKSGLAETVE